MAAKARGNNSELVYIAEVTKGTTPASGTVKTVRQQGETFDYTKPRDYDGDIVSDGQHSSTVTQTASIPGGFSFQLSHQLLDDFIPPLCGKNAFTTTTVTITGAIVVTNGVAVFTDTASPDLSGIVPNTVITLSGTASNDGDWLCTAVDDTADTVTFIAFKDGQADPVNEAGIASKTLTNITCRFGGNDFDTFTFEKRLGVLGSDDAALRFRGMQPDSLSISLSPGGGVTGEIGFLGLAQTVEDNGIVSPYSYTVHDDNGGGGTIDPASDTCIVNGTGTGNFAVGDVFWFEGDEVERTVVSIAGDATYAFSFTPAMESGTTIANATNLFVFTPGTAVGTAQKMENNLGYIRVNGQEVCYSAFNFSVSNNASPTYCVGKADPDSNEPADKTCSGSISAYVDTNEVELMKLVRAGTTFSGVLACVDRSGNVWGVGFQTLDGTQEEPKISDPGVITQNIPFNALKDSTYNTYCTFFKA